MFDLTLAQVSHPDRERDLATQLERRRILRDLLGSQAAEQRREAPRPATRPAPTRLTMAGR